MRGAAPADQGDELGRGSARSHTDSPLADGRGATADDAADERERRFDRYLAIDEESE